MLSSASEKTKMFPEMSSKNSSLDDSGIYLPVFSSRINTTLHNILLTLDLVKKIIIDLNFSKVTCPSIFNVSYKFACSFLVSTTSNIFFRRDTRFSQGQGKFQVFLSKSNVFLGLTQIWHLKNFLSDCHKIDKFGCRE